MGSLLLQNTTFFPDDTFAAVTALTVSLLIKIKMILKFKFKTVFTKLSASAQNDF